MLTHVPLEMSLLGMDVSWAEICGAGSAGEGAALTLVGGGTEHVPGVCRVGWCSAEPCLAPSAQPGPSAETLLCVWRGGHQLRRHLPHFLFSGQVPPAVSRCEVFSWANLLHVCSWFVMLVLIM